jgi:4-carboxymuconolactone decarboxylase
MSENNIGNYERGIETMNRLWGEELTEQMRNIWKAANLDVEKYVTSFALGEVWSRPGLDLKTRSLISLAAAVALEREGQIKLHTHGALHSGATEEEITETIIQLLVYASFPAAWQAMAIISKEFEKHKQAKG